MPDYKKKLFLNNTYSTKILKVLKDFYAVWDIVGSFHLNRGDFNLKHIYILRNKINNSFGVSTGIFSDSRWNAIQEISFQELNQTKSIKIRVAIEPLGFNSMYKYMSPSSTLDYIMPVEYYYGFHMNMVVQIKNGSLFLGIYPGGAGYDLKDDFLYRILNRVDYFRLKNFKGWK